MIGLVILTLILQVLPIPLLCVLLGSIVYVAMVEKAIQDKAKKMSGMCQITIVQDDLEDDGDELSFNQ